MFLNSKIFLLFTLVILFSLAMAPGFVYGILVIVWCYFIIKNKTSMMELKRRTSKLLK